MSPTEPNPRPERTCRECGATNEPGATECWLCRRRDWQSDGAAATAKTDELLGRRPSERPIAIAIVAGTIVILGLGMLLDIWQRSDFWGVGLLIATLVIPLGLAIWARARRRPPGGPSMTNRDLAAAGSTIAAAVILATWLFQTADSDTIRVIAVMLAIPNSTAEGTADDGSPGDRLDDLPDGPAPPAAARVVGDRLRAHLPGDGQLNPDMH
jgi:hypothetical protein